MIPTRFSRPLLLCTVCVGLTGCSGWQWPSLQMPTEDRANGAPQSIVPEGMRHSQDSQPVVSSWGNPDETPRTAGRQVSTQKASMQEISPKKVIKMKDKTIPLDARVAHLENEVAMMRQDMDRLLPALQRLIAGQEDVAMIVSGLNHRDAGMAAPVTHKVAMKEASSLKRIKPTPVLGTAGVPTNTYKGPAKLADIRTGEHAGKTRFVLDVGTETPFRYDLDNNEKLLIIELDNAPLSRVMTSSLHRSQFISAYKAEATEQGSRVIVQLKKPAKILNAETLRPTGGRGARIMFDIGHAS